VSATLRAEELAQLATLRLDLVRKAAAVALLVAGMRRGIPGFAQRRMTWLVFRTVCREDGVDLRLSMTTVFDAQLTRAGRRPWITMRPNLSRQAALFAAFHELGHWIGHPFDEVTALDDGTATLVEQEGDTIRSLALVSHRTGPPYPIVLGHGLEDGAVAMRVREPVRQAGRVEWVPRA
jgi:hypothetical protein